MIVPKRWRIGRADISFTVPQNELYKALEGFGKAAKIVEAKDDTSDAQASPRFRSSAWAWRNNGVPKKCSRSWPKRA